jgi:putative transposase
LNLPSKKHRHFHKYNDWKLNKSARLRKFEGNYYIDFYFEKDAPEIKIEGKQIGLDCGYKKLLISSENKIYDTGLEKVYEKISRKKQGSKRFKKSLAERNNKINESVNKIEIDDIKTIVVEDLKNVKKDSKGKINKKFNNKLQRWSYSKVLSKLSMFCEENSAMYLSVNPAYTSQTCSKCGFKHKDNRSGEKFKCLDCGYIGDADYNASLNILHRGIYSSSTTKS